ncbi:MAG TPA: hypothetical protein VNA65_10440 [Candidatus Dormibacteraeota bacterium]|nr:hypothetical protein [Candidatus Dormibacteraeota bacterium]
MANEASPPFQGPQLSPDHQWIWDGSRWLPVAKHEALFKNWSAVGAGLPVAEAAPQAQRMPTPAPTAAAYRPVPYVQSAPSPASQLPLWRQRRQTGINKYLYFVAGFVGLVMVGLVLSSLGTISLPWQTNSAPAPAESPRPGVSGNTDYERADSFANHLLAPYVGEVEDTFTLVGQTCAAGMTTSCQEALIAADNKTKAEESVIDRSIAPGCIVPQVQSLRTDLGALDAAALGMLQGFRDNRLPEFQRAFTQAAVAHQRVQADNSALSDAVKACEAPPTQ